MRSTTGAGRLPAVTAMATEIVEDTTTTKEAVAGAAGAGETRRRRHTRPTPTLPALCRLAGGVRRPTEGAGDSSRAAAFRWVVDAFHFKSTMLGLSLQLSSVLERGGFLC